MTPQLSTEIDDLLDRATHEKFTDGDSLEKMFDILGEIEEIETTFKQLEETKERYNRWQIELETNQDTFENLEELREQMTLRSLMWKSLNEW
jgi:anion-transporting  ArsA/GET3 family ATPase